MNTITRIFKAMPDQKRKSIIDAIVNVQGLKSPMTKYGKQCAREEFGIPNTGARNFMPILFEHCVNQTL